MCEPSEKAETRGVPLSSFLSFYFDSSVRREGSEVVKSRNMNSLLANPPADSEVVLHRDRESSSSSKQIRIALEKIHPFLFVKLMAMMGVALKALDCATKACGSAHLDFAAHVARERDKLDVLRDEFLAACHGAKASGDLTAGEKGLMEDVVAIFIALSLTCEYSYEAALHMAALTDSRPSDNLNRMRRIGDCSNRALRLCMVALVNCDAAHALNALRKIDAFDGVGMEKDERQAVQGPQGSQLSRHELAIASYLEKISHNVRLVAVRLIDADVALSPVRIASPYRRDGDDGYRGQFLSSAHRSRYDSMRLGAPAHGCPPDREAMRNS
jgi:hypothetical protein